MSQTSICNLALLRLGIAQPIADINDASVTARACRAVYDHCVERMLRERPWPFAIRQVELAIVADQTVGEWFYSYRYPATFLNIHRLVLREATVGGGATIYTTSTTAPTYYPFAIGSDVQGRLIHTNLPSAHAIGTVLVDDVALYDPLFTSALSWMIASEIALSLTKNESIRSFAIESYERAISDAVAAAHNEVKPDLSGDSEFIKARE